MEPLRFALLGLGAGAVYLLIGSGLVLVYRGSGIINFAQGALGMVGGFAFYELRQVHGAPTALAAVAAVLLVAAIGVGVHWGVLRPLRAAPGVSRLLAPLAVLGLLLALANLRYGADFFGVDPVLPTSTVSPFPNTPLGLDRLLTAVIGLVLTAGLAAGFRWTRLGMATAAVAENRLAASAVGISPDIVASATWAGAGALATLGAILTTSMAGTINVTSLVLLVLPGLAAALVGRFRSFGLTAVGALSIGVAEAEMARYVSDPVWARSVPFLVIIGLLVVRGRGLPIRGEAAAHPPEIGTGRIRLRVALPAVAVAALTALVADPAWASAITSTALVAIVVLSLVVVTGLAGQVSLAQFAFAGMGAWTSTRLAATYGVPFPLAVVAGVLATIPIGLVIGAPALRARGVNLAVATLGLALVLEEHVFGNPDRTGGSYGTQVGVPSLGPIEVGTVDHPQRYALLSIAALTGAMVVVANLRRGRAGRRLVAVRANERAAASLGVGIYGAKLYAFGLSSAIAALGGALLAFRNSFVVFGPFGILNSINASLLATIGGIGFVAGAIIGALLSPGSVSQHLLDQLFGDGPGTVHALAVVGALGAIVALLANPDGAAAVAATRLARLRHPRPRPTIAVDDGVGSPATVAPARVRPAALELRGASVAFGGTRALDQVDLLVRPGQVVGLLGPNGAGKTTLIDAVTGLVGMVEGTVRCGDADLTGRTASERARAGLGRSFQSLELFDTMTVRENLLVASDRRDAAAYATDLVRPGVSPLPPDALAAVEVLGLGDDLDRRPDQLSFGQRRLVAIARAIAAAPSVLLLDEPAAGLDRDERDELQRLVRSLADDRGMAVLIVEHDVGLVLDLCDEVTVLDAGRVIAAGTPDEVRSDEAVIEAYLGRRHASGAEKARSTPRKPTGEPVLRATGLCAGYGGLAAVRGLDLDVRPGEIVALLGPNGAGKTTTLMALCGELALLEGSVEVAGTRPGDPLHRRARAGVGLVTEQRCVFMGLSVDANLRLGRGRPADAYQLFPQLEPLARRDAGLLSGGEQQMLALARVLVGQPSVVLVDELSLGLAPLVIDRLFSTLRAVADGGVGVLLIEQHAHRALEIADRVVVLNRGAVAWSGPAADLEADEALLREAYLT